MKKFLLLAAAMVALSTPTLAAVRLSASKKAKVHPPERTCKHVKEFGHRFIFRCPGKENRWQRQACDLWQGSWPREEPPKATSRVVFRPLPSLPQ
jgi:hypothetical protein